MTHPGSLTNKKIDGGTLAEVDSLLFPRLLYERYHHFGLFALQAQ
jgi:hypothetical protein